METMKRYLVLGVVGLAVGLALIWGLAFSRPYQMHGSVIDPPQTAPDFSLGNYQLGAQQGKVVVLFFGYTSCTDVCPATLNKMKQILNRMGDQADKVQMVFVTVDPAVDNQEKMNSYTTGFDVRIKGLTDSEEALKAVWQKYGVTVQRTSDGAVDDASFEHSSRIYVIDRQGRLHATYTSDTSEDDLLADLKYLIKL
jgi:protein SCO1/2